MLHSLTLACTLTFLAAAPDMAAQISSPTSTRVITAIHGALQQHACGKSLRSDSIEVLGAPRRGDVAFIVTDVAKDRSSEALRVRLACEPRNACLPFYALVHDESLISNFQPTDAPARQRAAMKPLVKAGDKAMLRIDSAGLKISTEVICLQSGRLADVIRVRDVSRKHVFKAEVVSEGLLRGVLP
ncbi:MAG TPA: flagella basal body P-ring formation protein FlgA [Clostridia bacterium]|nr:flagella basal body P-ring formation protein FlgA [Clostridia bacterium]